MSIWFYIIAGLLAVIFFWKDIKKAISTMFKRPKLIPIYGESGKGVVEINAINAKPNSNLYSGNIYDKIKGIFRGGEDNYNSNRVQEYLSKKHISVMEIGHIWNRGNDFDRITLLNKLYEEYEDYSMVINLIDKKPSMLEYPEIKKMYDHIMRIKDMERNEEFIKGWRS
jgi:hypothetical protein